MLPQTIIANLVMLDDVAGSVMFASRLFYVCHMCSVWSCSHLLKELSASGGPANSSVLWQMLIKLHSAGLWTHHEVWSCQKPWVGRFVGLWQCSSCSSSHKRPETSPAAGLVPFYGPFQVFLCNGQFTSVSSTHWEKTLLKQYMHMGCGGGAVQPVWAASIVSCYQQCSH